jgi:hypothetical protein
MGRLGVAACVLAGCYDPQPSPGAPCGAADTCPTGLTCVAGTCERGPGGSLDAPVDGAASDAPDDPITGAWSPPVRIPGVNSSASDQDPSLTADRLTIAFTSNRVTSTDRDIYIGTRASVSDPFTVTVLAAVNSTADEYSPELSADGTELWFTSERSGSGDVYLSYKFGTAWTPPVLILELSSPTAADEDLALSPDRLTVLLARGGQLFRATRLTGLSPFGALSPATDLDITTDVAAPALTAGYAYFHAGPVRDLYAAKRDGAGFDPPVAITELNSMRREASPFVSADDRFLWFEQAGELYESSR